MQIKRKDMLLLSGTIIITLFICLMLLRAYAPALLGIPVDLRMVKTAKEVPPFFENVFRVEDHQNPSFILADPILMRAKPLFPDLGAVGPNDILGFRNRSVPAVADLIIIGDSQTYGNNANIEDNWPNQLREHLSEQNEWLVKYDMAVGGWGAIEYLEAFYKALFFKPKYIIVAFYSGNDPLETFRAAYSNERWESFRVNRQLSENDVPAVIFPSPVEKQWSVTFDDGIKTILTPELRFASNMDHPASKAGYEIMGLVAETINKIASESSVKVYFTIIPTKELVYKSKVEGENLDAPKDYQNLVAAETENINELKSRLESLSNAEYINVVEDLQIAAMKKVSLYPTNENGHPIAAGYGVIANTIANNIHVKANIPDTLFAISQPDNRYLFSVVRENKYWIFENSDWIESNGWPHGEVPIVTPRDVANLQRGGIISYIDKERFGPRN